MRTQNAPTIRLKDYEPPAYLIDKVDLDIALDPTDTRIVAKIAVRRASHTAASTPLKLDGDELKLERLVIDGEPLKPGDYSISDDELTITALPSSERFSLEIETSISPDTNTKLMGLYRSNGVYCTQCEAEGFRRITYFLDRPDVLAPYTVRLEADAKDCAHLLANGNPVESGELPDGRRYAIWDDPHPKPCYLFALVGGNLDVLSDTFTTASGRPVDLNIYVETGKAQMADYAMGALKRSMIWDETNYGREYDLDVFNIVAVSDFNMGAMENKGLNIFNDKYVLANENLATDTDYENIESIIAHEYFHNWTGNRITCRDWFQLCLKEGLTVYRDQEFSADLRERAVQRIQQVRILRAAQFAEDAGPLAHPVRPGKYREINNFYTATVYQKGAELVRMLAALVGPDGYREATDLYFERHDGEAARVEDFLKCFSDVSGLDLTQFALWYEQAGTPVVDVDESFDADTGYYQLIFKQSTPPTPGQQDKKSVVIPIRFGLLDDDGHDISAKTTSDAVKGDLIVLDKQELAVTFEMTGGKPVASLLRGFSAPVRLVQPENEEAVLLKAAHDSDSYNRWSALNGLLLQKIVAAATSKTSTTSVLAPAILEAIEKSVFDESLDPAFRAQVLTLPSVQDVAREIAKNVNPDAVVAAWTTAYGEVAERLGQAGTELYRDLASVSDQDATGERALKNALIFALLSKQDEDCLQRALEQFNAAKNMTDRLGALTALLCWTSQDQRADEALASYYDEFKSEPLAIDKWFSLQAVVGGRAGFGRVQKLIQHEAFTLENPNRARSLLGLFAMRNMSGFHQIDGSGYEMFADQILAIDPINPQLAARLLTAMNNWRSLEPTRQGLARSALSRIASTDGLSRDTSEIVDRSLE